jgi:simple sugar transport system permease protein
MIKKILSRYEFLVLVVIVVFSIIIGAINPNFFRLENIFDILQSYSLTGIFAIGMLIVLISGGIDLSFTAIATITGYSVAVLLLSHGSQLNIVVVFLIAAVMGTLLGIINACIIYFFKIPPIIATIATQNVYYGLLTLITHGKWLYGFPSWFGAFVKIKIFSLTNANDVKYGLSIVSVIWFAIILLGWFILRKTVLGRSIYALGGSESSASRAGFNILRLQLFVYGFMGLMAGVGSVIQALLVQTVAPNSLVGKELDVIAAVVLGGASLTGGVGTILGTVLGVALMAIMSNGLTLMHVSSFWYKVVTGFIILISVAAGAWRKKASSNKKVIIEAD